MLFVDVERILDALRAGVVEVTYFTKDGGMNVRRATLNHDLTDERSLSKKKTRYVNPDICHYYDLDKNGWRQFSWSRVETWKPIQEKTTPQYSVGDKVWVEGEVTEVDYFNQITVEFQGKLVSTKPYEPHLYIHKDDIKKHIPAPKPIVVGSKVGSIRNSEWRATVLGIHNDVAWCEFDANSATEVVKLELLYVI